MAWAAGVDVTLPKCVSCPRLDALTILLRVHTQKNYSPPFEAIRALVTDLHVLPECFAASDEVRRTLLRILDRVQSVEDFTPQPIASKSLEVPNSRVNIPANAPISAQQATVKYLEIEWTDLAAALRAISSAPPVLSADGRHRIAFLSHFTAASAALQVLSPDGWQPLPASVDEWCWPPAPLVSLRAAAKLAQRLGPDTVRAMWSVLAGAIAGVLVRIVDAVLADSEHATDLLTTAFDQERMSSLDTYQKQLRRVRRDPTFSEFTHAAADLTKRLETLNRNQYRVQTNALFSELYSTAFALSPRFNRFVGKLAQKCATSVSMQAPLKGIGRALEKLVLRPGAAAKFKEKGLETVDATTLVDILRGSLDCPDFIEIVFILELLVLLDVDMGDPKKAEQQGWDLSEFQIRIIHLKDRFTTPTSGGWADAMVNFSFAHGDDTHLVMELQIQVISFSVATSINIFLPTPTACPHICNPFSDGHSQH